MRNLLLWLAIGLSLAFPAFGTERRPIVIGPTGQQTQLPLLDTLKVSAATTANASINIPPGVAPTSPNNGDCWTTSSGLYCQVAGVTVGPMGSGGGSPGGSSGQIQYNNSGAFGGFTASGDATVNTSTGVVTVAQAAKWTTARTLTLGTDLSGSASFDGSAGFTLNATIANDAVTYAKLQNVSATSRILGRKTASAGDTEELTLSEALDFVGSAAQGDILVRSASGWIRKGYGVAGQVLQTNGAGADPSWVTPTGGSVGAGMGTLFSETVTSGSAASVTVSSIPATFRNMMIVISGRGTAAADLVLMNVQFNGDTGFNYQNQRVNSLGAASSNAATSAPLGQIPAASNVTGMTGSASIVLPNYAGTTFFKTYANTSGFHYVGLGQQIVEQDSGTWKNTAAITSMVFFPGSGAFANGTVISVYLF